MWKEKIYVISPVKCVALDFYEWHKYLFFKKEKKMFSSKSCDSPTGKFVIFP